MPAKEKQGPGHLFNILSGVWIQNIANLNNCFLQIFQQSVLRNNSEKEYLILAFDFPRVKR